MTVLLSDIVYSLQSTELSTALGDVAMADVEILITPGSFYI